MIEHLARVRDEELRGSESGPGARMLLAGVLAEPPPRRRPAPVRRLVLVAAAVVAVTAGAVGVTSVLTTTRVPAASYSSEAIDVVREGDFYVARLKDPLADHVRYTEAFKAVGLDVDIELVPVAPEMVGRVLQADLGGSGQGSTDLVPEGTEPVNCQAEPARCVLVIKVAAGTTGPVHYKIGRAARPGESIKDSLPHR